MLATLERYARPLGQAFQIADDLLGTFGAPEMTGKPNASDLREGKRTLLLARALEMATPADAAALRAGLGNPRADAEELRAVIERSGAARAARETADALCQESLRALAPLPAAVADHLRDIALFSIARAR